MTSASSALSAPLHGIDIVLTRPVGAARSLIASLRAAGANCINLPVQSVRRLGVTPALLQDLAAAERADAIVFASPMAVRACYRLHPGFNAHGVVLAQGPATARVLRRHGVEAMVPSQGFTTEDLLQQPFFDRVKGRHVVRLAGQGGRDLLVNTLRASGARADAIALYQRVPARWTRQHRQWLSRLSDPVLVVTSTEALELLPRLLDAEQWERARRWRMLVSSPRLELAARSAGVQRVACAASAASADLRAGLLILAEASRGR